jgi:hypothetical protein
VTEQEVANEAFDKVFRFLCTHMDKGAVADALLVRSVNQLLETCGSKGAAVALRRLADAVDSDDVRTFH